MERALHILFSGLAWLTVSSTLLLADELPIAEAFERADTSNALLGGSVLYTLDNCTLSKTLTYNRNCRNAAVAEETKSILMTIDLREVERFTVGSERGKFLARFDLDYDGPGMFFVAKDRLENGAEGSFKRFAEADRLALETADLASGQKYLHCDGSTHEASASATIGLRTDREPAGWRRLIEEVRQCRRDDAFEFVDKFSEN